jgi:hypothetical protein
LRLKAFIRALGSVPPVQHLQLSPSLIMASSCRSISCEARDNEILVRNGSAHGGICTIAVKEKVIEAVMYDKQQWHEWRRTKRSVATQDDLR